MPKLKDRDRFPPGAYQFVIPEVGMKKPLEGSFRFVVGEIIKIRRANPFLAEKFAWSTNWDTVSNELEAYTVARCRAHGWNEWLVEDEAPFIAAHADDGSKKNKWGDAVGVRRIAAGIAILIDWLGAGGVPVAQDLSQRRAGVCSTCPKNDPKGDWKSFFTAPVAEKIRVQIEMKNDLRLKTAHDEKLGICMGCDCPLTLKVHTPLDHILAHTSDGVRARLDPRCWVLKGDA